MVEHLDALPVIGKSVAFELGDQGLGDPLRLDPALERVLEIGIAGRHR